MTDFETPLTVFPHLHCVGARNTSLVADPQIVELERLKVRNLNAGLSKVADFNFYILNT